MTAPRCEHCGARLPRRKRRPRTLLDDIVVERMIAGDVVHSSYAERAAAIAKLDCFGYSASKIAERLHISERTVQRHRLERV